MWPMVELGSTRRAVRAPVLSSTCTLISEPEAEGEEGLVGGCEADALLACPAIAYDLED